MAEGSPHIAGAHFEADLARTYLPRCAVCWSRDGVVTPHPRSPAGGRLDQDHCPTCGAPSGAAVTQTEMASLPPSLWLWLANLCARIAGFLLAISRKV